MKATYQTRVGGNDGALTAYAELYGRLERRLFAQVCAGRPSAALKREYLRKYGIPARLFNAVRVSLEGRLAAARAAQGLHLETLQGLIDQAEQRLKELVRQGRDFEIHQKKRRLSNLRARLERVKADLAAERVRLCFGSKKLWRKQFNLPANGYANHGDWLADWQEARSNEFFVLGSRDETGGCQLCVGSVAEDGSLTLRLRLPDCLAEAHGRYVHFEGVRFAYGHDQVLAALEASAEFSEYRRRHGEKLARATDLGQAVCYRFKRDGRGWRVFVTVDLVDVPRVTDQGRGAVGVDLNTDHLAVSEVDPSGNWLRSWRVPLVTYGKSQRQAEALIGDAVAGVVEYARRVGKPIVMEQLDFRRKKAALEGASRRYSRMLSSFSYGKVKAYFSSRGFRNGVEVIQVNPAYSSVIGRVKFMERYGLSVHQAAALVLARRLLGCSERIPRRRVLPVGNGVQVAFTLPVRKRVKHVWSYWGAVAGQLRPALAAQQRLGRPNPVRAGLGPVTGAGRSVDPFAVPG